MTRFLNKFNKVVTGPAVEPVSANTYKSWQRIQGDSDDSIIEDVLKTCRVACENYCNRPFINTTFRQVQDDFELDNYAKYSIRDELAYRQDVLSIEQRQAYIQLQKATVQSVTSVTTYDENNNATVYSSDNYFLSEASNRVVVNENATIPNAMRSREAVQVDYVAGFGAAASDVPQLIKQAIFIYAQSIYDFNRNPENLIAEAYDLPQGAMTLLNPYRLEIGLNG